MAEEINMGRVVVSAVIESLEDVMRVQRDEISDEQVRRVSVDEALVDTGATNLALPISIIRQLGLMPMSKRRVRTAAGVREVNAYNSVRLKVQGRECNCDVIEVPDDCPVLIGQVPLELLDFVVDPGRRQLIGNPDHGGVQMHEMF